MPSGTFLEIKEQHNLISSSPSYHFLPIHHTQLEYKGHAKIYAHQEWGSSFQSYDKMNDAMLGSTFFAPPNDDPYKNVSVLISSYNTKIEYIHACLESIKHQNGYLTIALIKQRLSSRGAQIWCRL